MLGLIWYHISLSGPTEGREHDSLMDYQLARFNIGLYPFALHSFDSLMGSGNRVGALSPTLHLCPLPMDLSMYPFALFNVDQFGKTNPHHILAGGF